MKTLAELMAEQQDAVSAWADDKSNWEAVKAADKAVVQRLETLIDPPQRISYQGRMFRVDYVRKSLDFVYAVDVERLDGWMPK